MSTAIDPTKLDTCGCCADAAEEPSIHNPPGQAALAWRIGTHPTFLDRMKAQLHRQTVSGTSPPVRPLQALTTRAADDPSVALLDAWASVADVLTFYQERIANEGFLRTATERRSVLDLARTIGYELAPGVAASTFLAFTVDDSPGATGTAAIPTGTQVLSIPTKQDELPQTFETTEDFTGFAAWNTLRPRTTLDQGLDFGEKTVYLQGVSVAIQPGDALLLVGSEREGWAGSERWDLRFVQTVTRVPNTADAARSYTAVTWEPGLGSPAPRVDPADNPAVYVLRQQAHLFGYNAPDFRTMPAEVKEAYGNPGGSQWPDFEIRTVAERQIHLDTNYPKVLAGSWVALVKSNYTEVYRVVQAVPDDRADFTLAGQVTRLDLDGNEHLSWFGLRQTLVLCQSEALALAGMPDPSPIAGNTIELDGLVAGLAEGQPVLVSGTLSDGSGTASEVAFLAFTTDAGGRTTLVLQDGLANAYRRGETVVYANVVPATHGETVAEVLGSGNGAQVFQRFKLKKPPLTYVAAATASGSESTLDVRVDGLLWDEAPSLYGQAADARRYLVRLDDDANAYVIFGDGRQGARLTTGQENVTAVYRSGLGLAGEVGAGTLQLLKKRPFGVKAVTNPVAASGAEDPETLDDARTNAPLTVLTLERIVSVQDYEDFARAFAGVGKAQAMVVWSGEQPRIHLTVASASGEAVAAGSALHTNLLGAIEAARDPQHPAELGTFTDRRFTLAATVVIDPAYRWEDVEADLQMRLQADFGFDQRAFGQPVAAAEVLRTLHAAAGVVAVDLDALYFEGSPATFSALLTAQPARFDPATGTVLPAELLRITTAGGVLAQGL